MQLRPRHQRGQPLHELQRAHHQTRRSIASRRLQSQRHLACGVELHQLVRKSRPIDLAALLLQPLAIVGVDPHRRVQADIHRCRRTAAGAPVLARRRIKPRLLSDFMGDMVHERTWPFTQSTVSQSANERKFADCLSVRCRSTEAVAEPVRGFKDDLLHARLHPRGRQRQCQGANQFVAAAKHRR